MTVQERIKNRRIGIVGMARSGLSAAMLADSFGGHPFVSDAKKAELLVPIIERLKAVNIPFETGGHTDQLLKCDYLVVSPGVPLNIDIISRAKQQGVPVFSEIEFAYWACKGRIVAVTGSNGKTTTTTLLGEIFSAAGFDTFVGGNIGRPFSEFVLKIPDTGIAVIEVSNFQLETIADFAPDTALILNLTPDHLDRHGTFESYKRAKYRIAENQSAAQTLILNLDDPETNAADISTAANIQYFTVTDSPRGRAFVRDGMLYGRRDGREIPVINASDILIPGPHNLQNAAAAVSAVMPYGVEAEVIARVLRTFPGVEHRLENAGRVAGVHFINDSKGTNVDSVCYALRSVNTPIYLIAGGRDKGAPYTPIIEYGKGKIKGIVAIGEAKEKIFQALGQIFPVQFAETLEEAVKRGFEMAYPGETVLLSPGCASFDMFENYEHRGRAFKAAVAELKKSKNGNETVTQK